MNISVFKIFLIFGIVSAWAEQALKDGTITLVEAANLATKIAKILGVNVEIEVPAEVQETIIPSGKPEKEPSGDLSKPDYIEGKASSG